MTMTPEERKEIEQASWALFPFVEAWHLPLNPEDLDLMAYVALTFRHRPLEENDQVLKEVREILEEHGHCGSPFGRHIPLEDTDE